VRPVEGIRDKAVLCWVEVNVVDVAGEIGLVSDGVLPETPLPKEATGVIPGRYRFGVIKNTLGEDGFDAAPAVREIGVTLGKRENGVEMVRENDDGVDVEWALCAGFSEGLSENRNLVGQEGGLTVCQGDGEEEGAARDEVAAVVDHDRRAFWLCFCPA